MKINAYWKSVIAGLMPVAAAIQGAVDDSKFDVSDGINVAIALLIALGVYAVPNARRP